MSKDNLAKVLTQLFGDPALFERVRQNGWGGLGLEPNEIKMLEERDSDGLNDYLGQDASKMVIVQHWLPKKE
ncbi:MAG: hypothetical protein AMXMBFR36_01410 [Acidobacteriota bacterium]